MPLQVSSTTNGVGSGVSSSHDDVHGLEHANRLVQSVYHQITEGDAPSSNFEKSGNSYINGSGISNINKARRLPSGKFATTAPARRSTSNSYGELNSDDYYQSQQQQQQQNNAEYNNMNDTTSVTASEISMSSMSGATLSPYVTT